MQGVHGLTLTLTPTPNPYIANSALAPLTLTLTQIPSPNPSPNPIQECTGSQATPIIFGCVIIVLLAGLLLLWQKTKPLERFQRLKMLQLRLNTMANYISLRAKFKQLAGFYQVTTNIQEVYSIEMPEQVTLTLTLNLALALTLALTLTRGGPTGSRPRRRARRASRGGSSCLTWGARATRSSGTSSLAGTSWRRAPSSCRR